MKKSRKLLNVGLSILYIEIPTKLFDYPFCTFIIGTIGPVYGFLILYPCAVLVRYEVMLFYDKHCNDALGMRKDPPKPPSAVCSSRYKFIRILYKAICTILWYCKVGLFWAYLTYHEPLYIVLRFRKTKDFSWHTIRLLAGVMLASCLMWNGMIGEAINLYTPIKHFILKHWL